MDSRNDVGGLSSFSGLGHSSIGDREDPSGTVGIRLDPGAPGERREGGKDHLMRIHDEGMGEHSVGACAHREDGVPMPGEDEGSVIVDRG